jgi:shikimate dehydrogenase/3-dehydroquinate dehydratase type I
MEIVATYVPGAGRDLAAEIAQPPAEAALVELRADLLPADARLRTLVAASPRPVIVTLRSRAEGGAGPEDGPSRRRFFENALALPAAFFDLEAERDLELLGRVVPAERAILSLHLPAGVPDDLAERARRLLAHPARFVKVVPTARSLADLLEVLRLAAGFDRGPRAQRRAIVFAAGEAGRASRLLGPLLAAPIGYAAWAAGREAAVGQLAAAELAAVAGHLHGRPRRLFAVLGRPVASSLSPRMHAAAYRALQLPNLFVPVEIAEPGELGELLVSSGESALDSLGLPVGGFAVTMPWKEEAARRCTVVAPRAQRARAVNTVLPRRGRLLGDCTDIDGLVRVLAEEGIELAGARVLVLGSGAAARAALVALELVGAEAAVAARDGGRAEGIAREFGVARAAAADSERCRAVINATPGGLGGSADPLLDDLRLASGAVAVDLPYGSVPTRLEELSHARQWRYVSGRDVLLYQGVAQFAAMTGHPPPVRAMAEALGLGEAQS